MNTRLIAAAAATLWLAVTAPAQAQVLKDAQWRAWFDAGRYAELDRAARARLAQQPGDAEAVAALAIAAAERGDGRHLQRALEAANACITQQPQAAPCHYARGTVLGVQAVQGGALTAVRLAGDVRAALARAVEIDPLLYEARQGLVQFYLAVPSYAGGSIDKARELAGAAQTRQPEHAKLLRAMVAVREDRLAEAEQELAALKAGDDVSLRHDARELKAQVGTAYFRSKRFAQAKAVFEALQREAPRHATPLYGLGRVAHDEGRFDDAIALFERARGLEGALRLPIDHRLGQSLVAKGDKAQARVVLERYIASARDHWVNPRNIDDAKKLLAEISG